MSRYEEYAQYLEHAGQDIMDGLRGCFDAKVFPSPRKWSSNKDRQWHYEYGFETARGLIEKDKEKEEP